MKFTLALAQTDSALGNTAGNVAHHVDAVRRARSGGAELVVFPELSCTGYTLRDINWDVAIRPPDPGILRPLVEESRDIAILCGGVEESAEFALHNAAFFCEGGKLRSVHRKVYLPTYGMFEENRYFSAGSSVRAFDTAFGRVGVLICEDLWHLPLPYLLAKDRADVIITIAASPTRLAGDDAVIHNSRINSEQHRSIARLLSTYVVFCNRVGYEDGVNFWGGSEVVAPSGDITAQAKLFEEDLVFAEIDDQEIRRARRFSRHFLDDDPRLVVEELGRILSGRKHDSSI
jgi:predicted amidohydrolase